MDALADTYVYYSPDGHSGKGREREREREEKKDCLKRQKGRERKPDSAPVCHAQL